VKSGGHAAFSGASNIDSGITIDLSNLNQVDIYQDESEASVGPGNTWYDVYSELEGLGLSVIGGGVSAIGVGGFTLGGWISFFSGLYGWGCDNVNTYEVSPAYMCEMEILTQDRLYSQTGLSAKSAILIIQISISHFVEEGITLE
jgi:hypothetical protein